MRATARAHSNIALIKYWGKRDETLILPHNSSLSVTLDTLYTTTSIAFQTGLDRDLFILNGKPASEKERLKVSRFLDLIRGLADVTLFAEVVSENVFATGAGLASSASGFAALSAAATHALGIELDGKDLSKLARRGSGSATRSIYGGFVEWQKGVQPDGEDSYAVPIASADDWDLHMLIVTVDEAAKDISSRDGMRRTVETSPFYPAWLETIDQDLAEVKTAIYEKDFQKLGEVAERNALKMHATTLASNPPFWYWQSETLLVMNTVKRLRAEGTLAYFTIDAGANVVVLCQARNTEKIREQLAQIPGVRDIVMAKPGPGVTILDHDDHDEKR